MARFLRDSQWRPLFRDASLGQDAFRAGYVEGDSIPHPHKQAAARSAGLLEEIQRSSPSNRRGARTRRAQIGLAGRSAEINCDHGLGCGRVTVEIVGLELPLLDCSNRRPAQNKISPENLQIFYAAVASHSRLQDHRSVELLG